MRSGLLHPLLPDDQEYPIEISFVFGTYNRRKLLERCVRTIREAATGHTFEIVVSDGGSNDGTRDWIRRQPDMVLLEGDLTGAVRAFNAAAKAARGRFIVALNDDAEINHTAIAACLTRMKDPMVGQIAMAYRERGKLQTSSVLGVTYANFPMTRASIVRAAEQITGGMWAPVYQTYGGDTELSCWVYRLGYQVVAAPDAIVVHHEHADELRARNVRTDKKRMQFHRRWPNANVLKFRGPTPGVASHEVATLQRLEAGEGVARRWDRIATLDPSVGQMPVRQPPRAERVLHWHLWTDEDPQTSMASAMAKFGSAGHMKVDWTNLAVAERGRTFVESAAKLRPTVAFLQLQASDAVSLSALEAVRQAKDHDPSLVIAVWSGDVGPGKGPWSGSGDEWQYEIAKRVDLMLFTGTGQVEHHRARGMKNAAYLQIGFDEDRYHPGDETDYGRMHAIVFMGQNYGPHFDRVPGSEAGLRRAAVAKLSTIPGFRAYGSGFGPPMHQARAGSVYRKSLMAVSVSLTSSLGRYTSDRMIRSMACGCTTLVKRFHDMEGLGLRDGENCIVWDNVDDLHAKARHWLSASARGALREIGRNGARLMKEHHTWSVRVQELAALLARVRGQR